ncbi:hypothetical protein [Bosea caraganae]|uniref:hypothetical protein n=1 Tax=Bosea caraganae TaxID=2763117 RepID=UPI0015F08CBA|nr:hypothetical protein [Bosea caraganae]
MARRIANALSWTASLYALIGAGLLACGIGFYLLIAAGRALLEIIRKERTAPVP